MPTLTKSLRYQLPKKAIKGDCPACGHHKTLSRYVDTQTGDPLPEAYGRCDRESNCGYHLNPYAKGSSGLSFHDEQKALEGIGPIPKTWFRMAGNLKRKGHVTRDGVVSQLMQMEGASSEQAEKVAAYIFDKPGNSARKLTPDPVVYCIPDEVYQASIGHYERNQLAHLLDRHLGNEAANRLLTLFRIGTSSRWPGACVFWYIDEQSRKRGGQIKLFGDDFHTVKYKDAKGETRSKTSWVHSALLQRYTEKKMPVPEWLIEYEEKAERSPCLFGLPQLLTAPIDQPVAIVEAPKTAILCSHYFPDFIWMAAGGKSYLNAERLAPLKARKIILFPDLNAYQDLVNEKGQVTKGWLTKAQQLQAVGYDITVSDYLEGLATEEDRVKGLDLADYLLSTSISYEPREHTPTEPDASTTCVPITQAARITFPLAPLAFDAADQHRRIQWCVIADEYEPEPVVSSTLNDWFTTPGSILKPDEAQLERLPVEPDDHYPAEWDRPSPPGAVPTLKAQDFFDWQRNSPPFNQLGLISLLTPTQP